MDLDRCVCAPIDPRYESWQLCGRVEPTVQLRPPWFRVRDARVPAELAASARKQQRARDGHGPMQQLNPSSAEPNRTGCPGKRARGSKRGKVKAVGGSIVLAT